MPLVKTLLQLFAVIVLVSCGGGGGSGGVGGVGSSGTNSTPPYIYAEVDSFSNSNSAVVYVLDSNGNPVTNAIVKMNTVTFPYNVSSKNYRGALNISPMDKVSLEVQVGSQSYTASDNQFAIYPKITAPAAGFTLGNACWNQVSWSASDVTMESVYGIGVVDPNFPNNPIVWPTSGDLQTITSNITSISIPPNILTNGDRQIVVGVAKSINVSNAAYGSTLVISGYDYIPVTIAESTHTLNGITITPTGLVLTSGVSKQFKATGTFLDCTSQDVTSLVTWSTADSNVATVSNDTNSKGNVSTFAQGSTTILATSGKISNSTSLTVNKWARVATSSSSDPFLNSQLLGAIWTGSQFVAVGADGRVAISPDGLQWTSYRILGTLGGDLHRIAWSGTQYVAVGDTGRIFTSTDGVNWTQRNSGTSSDLYDVAWSGSKFVAVGQFGKIITSQDGVVWTSQQSAATLSLFSLVWSGTQFVAVGQSGMIITSLDGINWTQRNSGATNTIISIVWSGSKFVAVGGPGIIFSTNGITWTPHDPSAPYDYLNACWTGTEFIVVGSYQYIHTSPDGLSWSSQLSGTSEYQENVVSSGNVTIILLGDGSILRYAGGTP